MDRIALLANAATRAHAVNRAFGSQLSPFEIEAQFADEDIDLIVAWLDHTKAA